MNYYTILLCCVKGFYRSIYVALSNIHNMTGICPAIFGVANNMPFGINIILSFMSFDLYFENLQDLPYSQNRMHLIMQYSHNDYPLPELKLVV